MIACSDGMSDCDLVYWQGSLIGSGPDSLPSSHCDSLYQVSQAGAPAGRLYGLKMYSPKFCTLTPAFSAAFHRKPSRW